MYFFTRKVSCNLTCNKVNFVCKKGECDLRKGQFIARTGEYIQQKGWFGVQNQCIVYQISRTRTRENLIMARSRGEWIKKKKKKEKKWWKTHVGRANVDIGANIAIYLVEFRGVVSRNCAPGRTCYTFAECGWL